MIVASAIYSVPVVVALAAAFVCISRWRRRARSCLARAVESAGLDETQRSWRRPTGARRVERRFARDPALTSLSGAVAALLARVRFAERLAASQLLGSDDASLFSLARHGAVSRSRPGHWR